MQDLHGEEGGLWLEYLHTSEHTACHVPAHFYRMRSAAGLEVGSINLRLADTPHMVRFLGHIGYAVLPQHRGRRYAAAAFRLLVPVARQQGIDSLWITCDPGNLASRRTCELAGAAYVDTVAVLTHQGAFPAGLPQKSRYRLLTGEST